jgi:APA family basic amino acid/polyamine antiporter
MKETKKLGLAAVLLSGIGCIIGSGIFGSLSTVVNDIGAGVFYALIVGVIIVISKSLAKMFTIAALPVGGSDFVHATKLIHPAVGAFVAIENFLEPLMVALYGVLFADYFAVLFPDLNISSTAIGVTLLLIFTCLAWFGNKVSIMSGNAMVVVLLIAIGLYVFLGLPNLDPANISFVSVIKPGISMTAIAAAGGVLSSSLSGALTIAQLADDIENPRKNIPLGLILSPVIVAVLYMLMAVVTVGVIPSASVESLAQVAGNFMSPVLMTFFIVGGPICGVLTSLIPIALGCMARMSAAADCKLLPAVFTKKNKYGVPPVCLAITMGLSIIFCATGASFGLLMEVYSFVNTLVNIPVALAPIFAYKMYPKCCQNSTVRMNRTTAIGITAFATALAVYFAVVLAVTIPVPILIGIVVFFVVAAVYYVLRVNYLKKQGIDLVAELKAPYQPWEEMEASYKA